MILSISQIAVLDGADLIPVCSMQVIDTDSGSLQNVITFENGASFVVDSSLEKTGNKRLVFKFSGARLNLPSKSWNLPPFGKGW